jgi:DNA-binding NtrC family response regulator
VLAKQAYAFLGIEWFPELGSSDAETTPATPEKLLRALPQAVTEQRTQPLVSPRTPLNPTLEAIERAYILWVLGNEHGNKSRTAEVLGIDPSTLYRKLGRYGLDT